MVKNLSIVVIVLILLTGVFLLFKQIGMVDTNPTATDSQEAMPETGDNGFPIYPGASDGGSGDGGQIWKTGDAVSQVTAWYMSNLVQTDWKVQSTIDVLKSDVQEIELTKDSDNYLLRVRSTGDSTEISLISVQ